jgi:hypothetical protein
MSDHSMPMYVMDDITGDTIASTVLRRPSTSPVDELHSAAQPHGGMRRDDHNQAIRLSVARTSLTNAGPVLASWSRRRWRKLPKLAKMSRLESTAYDQPTSAYGEQAQKRGGAQYKLAR